MSENIEGLMISPVFTALTRPPMVFGVTLDYLCICALLALCGFIAFDNPFFLTVYAPLYVVGWLLCKLDPNIFRILIKRGECAYSPNKRFWRCQSYAPF